MKKNACLFLITACLLVACKSGDKPNSSFRFTKQSIMAASLNTQTQSTLISTFGQPATLWDLQENKIKYAWELSAGGNATINHVVISRDGSSAVIADPHQLVLWDTKTGKQLGQKSFGATIRSVALSQSPQYILVGMDDGNAYYFYLKTNQVQWTFHHDKSINTVALSNDGKYALTGADDKQVKLWDLSTGELVRSFTLSDSVSFVSFSADSSYILTNAAQKEVKIWQVDEGNLISTLEAPKISIRSAAFSADSTRVAAGNTSGKLMLWNTRTGKRLKQWQLPRENIWRPTTVIVLVTAFNESGSAILTEDSSGYLRQWNL